MKQYPIYKDSGIQGIDEIPEHWYFSQLKFISYIKGRIGWQGLKSDEFIDEGPFLITGMNFKNGIIRWDEVYHITEERYNEAPEIQLKTGDVLMTKDGTIGKLLYVDEIPFPHKASLNSHLLVIRPLKEVYYPKYLYYQLDSHLFKKHIEDTKTGTTFYGITQEAVGNFKMIIPNFEEQFKIANFLDQKTSEIDQLIAAKEELINKLEAQRKAIINEAVTGQAYKRGLIPIPQGIEIKFKDSGIEWLGEIPLHWDVAKLKILTRKIVDGTHFTPNYIESGIPFLRVTDIQSEKINLDRVKYISVEEHNELKKRCNPEKGDVLLSKNGTIGITKVIDWDFDFSIFVSLCLIKFGDRLLPEFFSFFFKSNIVDQQIMEGSKTTSVTNLHLEKINELLQIVPSIKEQKLIIEYLKKYTNNIENLIHVENQSISKLKDYKQSLISEAVTGKIDVREWQKDELNLNKNL